MEGLDALIQRLLEGRVNRGKRIPLIETEVRQLCITAKEVFLRQPNLLELAAPINVCGMHLAAISFFYASVMIPVSWHRINCINNRDQISFFLILLLPNQ